MPRTWYGMYSKCTVLHLDNILRYSEINGMNTCSFQGRSL